ncbi:hypothetical protein LTS00_018259, partial [Friedmanniomyces endolithicus]
SRKLSDGAAALVEELEAPPDRTHATTGPQDVPESAREPLTTKADCLAASDQQP